MGKLSERRSRVGNYSLEAWESRTCIAFPPNFLINTHLLRATRNATYVVPGRPCQVLCTNGAAASAGKSRSICSRERPAVSGIVMYSQTAPSIATLP